VANDEETAVYRNHHDPSLIRPQSSLAAEAWRRLLFHPDEELLTGEIFAVIVPAVLLGRVAALRHAKALPVLDPAKRHDVRTSTVQAVRCFAWAASILGMGSPPFYADPAFGGVVEMVPGVPPASRLGKLALSGRSPQELAFVAGRHLAGYREEHFVRLLLPSIPDLEDLFLAALSIGNPGLPLNADMKRRVVPIAKAIEPILEPMQVDRLRGQFLRFVEEGGRTNLQRWAVAADRTAARAGFLLAGDLEAAQTILRLDEALDQRETLDDLIVFLTSERYSKLRRQIGIAIP
jgi:golgin subfamily B member 1